jgi:hypothetical protein
VVATATVDLTGVAAGDYVWVNIPTVTLVHGGYYALLSNVTAYDGQNWKNPGPITMHPYINNIYGAYRVPAGALATTASNESFIGLDLGWTAPGVVTQPPVTSGLNVWLEASQLGLADGAIVYTWPNFVWGPTPVMETGLVPATLKANASNGRGVIRFSGGNASHLHGLTDATHDFTMIYVVRRWGGIVGRGFSTQYPPTNILVGFHSSAQDIAYDGGWLNAPTNWGDTGSLPAAWKLYGLDGASPASSTFRINGVAVGGNPTSSQGLGGGYVLSGYRGDNQIDETMDCDVAELLIFTRQLSDAERISVENYLRTKWITPAAARSGDSGGGSIITVEVINRMINETVRVIEGLIPNRALLRQLVEGLRVHEGTVVYELLARNIGEGVRVVENIVRTNLLTRNIGEVVRSLESTMRSLALSRSIVEIEKVIEAAEVPWTPAALGANLLAWLDASDAATITVTGSGVSQWNDKSSFGRHGRQTNDPKRPAYAPGKVTFSGQLVLDMAAFVAYPIAYDYLVVGKPNNGTTPGSSGWRVIFQTGADHFPLLVNPSNNVGVYPAAGLYTDASLIWPSNTLGMVYAQLSDVSPVSMSRDGASLVSLAPSFGETGRVTELGNRASVTMPFGEINEVIMVPYGASLDTRQRLEGYAAWKWGLQANLPANHPYKNWPPTTLVAGGGPYFVRALNRMIDEVIRLSEAVGLTGALYRVIDELEKVGETFLFSRPLVRLTNETVRIAEALGFNRVLTRAINETMRLTEVTLRSAAFTRMVNETVRVVEVIEYSVARVLIKMVNETVQLVESFAQAFTLLRIHNEVVEESENRIPARIRVQHWDEAIEVPESEPEGYRTLLRLLDEPVTTVETTDYARELARTREEDVTVPEVQTIARSLWRIVDESLFFNELTNFFAGIPSLVCSALRIYAIFAGECGIAPVLMGTTMIGPEVEGGQTQIDRVLDAATGIGVVVDGQPVIGPEVEGTPKIEECC